MKPIELRINKVHTNGQVIYTVDRVWPGVGNVSFGNRRFSSRSDAVTWCKTEWPGVPILNSY